MLNLLRRTVRIGLLAGLAAALGGCARPASAPAAGGAARPFRVVCTTTLLTDLVRRLGGPHVAVDGLMAPGVDPHLYRAAAGDIDRLARADLVVFHGLHLEGKLSEVLDELDQHERPAVAAAAAIDPNRLLRWHSESPDAGASDPHVWFDVALWREVAAGVAGALAEHDPDRAAVYRQRGEVYRAELADLEAWCRATCAKLPRERRVLVTAHDAFAYFGRAYGFEVHGLQGISTAAEAGTADVQRLAAMIAERRIPAIFIESSVPTRTLEAVRAAVRSRGHEVAIGGELYSDSLGEPDSPAGTYVGMVRANLETIVGALSGEPGGE